MLATDLRFYKTQWGWKPNVSQGATSDLSRHWMFTVLVSVRGYLTGCLPSAPQVPSPLFCTYSEPREAGWRELYEWAPWPLKASDFWLGFASRRWEERKRAEGLVPSLPDQLPQDLVPLPTSPTPPGDASLPSRYSLPCPSPWAWGGISTPL